MLYLGIRVLFSVSKTEQTVLINIVLRVFYLIYIKKLEVVHKSCFCSKENSSAARYLLLNVFIGILYEIIRLTLSNVEKNRQPRHKDVDYSCYSIKFCI